MKYHSSALRRVLRYHLQAAPLLLPLLSVVGALCGGYYYLLTIISIIVTVPLAKVQEEYQDKQPKR